VNTSRYTKRKLKENVCSNITYIRIIYISGIVNESRISLTDRQSRKCLNINQIQSDEWKNYGIVHCPSNYPRYLIKTYPGKKWMIEVEKLGVSCQFCWSLANDRLSNESQPSVEQIAMRLEERYVPDLSGTSVLDPLRPFRVVSEGTIKYHAVVKIGRSKANYGSSITDKDGIKRSS